MTEEQARRELRELVTGGYAYKLRETELGNGKVVGGETFDTAHEAFWQLVVLAGRSDSLASPETMEYLRGRLLNNHDIFCNGFGVDVIHPEPTDTTEAK